MAESSAKEKQEKEAAAGDAPTQSAKGGTEPTLKLPEGTKPGAPGEEATGRLAMRLGVYELIEKIGQGGMGSVWKARHTVLNKIVAVKLLPPHLMTDAEAVSRFKREMEAVGKLENAYIVRAMDAGQAEEMHYLVMEHIEGTDLARLVKQRGKRSVVEACKMIRHAALGLAHAHEHGLVHRDIKPSNLLLSSKGLVRILDLGLARLASERGTGDDQLTGHGETMGTPDYMSPEQWNSAHAAGPPADLYALGCTLFFLLTGKPPFARDGQDTFAQKMKAHLMDAPPSLREARSDVPPELEALYQRLMAKEPSQRPESARKLADEFLGMVRSWTKSPAPTETIAWPGAAGQRLDWPSRRAVVAMAIGGAALVVLGAVMFAMRAQRGEKQSPAPPLAVAPFHASQARAHQQLWATYLGVPIEYTNSLGMKFCLIPPGEYERGSSPAEVDEILATAKKKVATKVPPPGALKGGRGKGIRSEAPRHRVRITQAFYLAACEVSQGQYQWLMQANPSQFGPDGEGRDKVEDRGRNRLPVENMSFDDAVEFCGRLNKREGVATGSLTGTTPSSAGYRLPTDAEWEYACRAGTTTDFWFGGLNDDFAPYVWIGHGTTREVGSLAPNPFGLFDMHGNVWELCQDFFAEDDYARLGTGVVESPTGPADGTGHMLRGGAYAGAIMLCRSASRSPFGEPRLNAGFRVALAFESVRAALERATKEK